MCVCVCVCGVAAYLGSYEHQCQLVCIVHLPGPAHADSHIRLLATPLHTERHAVRDVPQRTERPEQGLGLRPPLLVLGDCERLVLLRGCVGACCRLLGCAGGVVGCGVLC